MHITVPTAVNFFDETAFADLDDETRGYAQAQADFLTDALVRKVLMEAGFADVDVTVGEEDEPVSGDADLIDVYMNNPLDLAQITQSALDAA